MRSIVSMAAALVALTTVSAHASIVITEWMYNGLGVGDIGEYVEITNTGPGNVDFTGWSFDDNGQTPGSQSLSGFGVVTPGQSVIFTDETAANFAANWGLSGVSIVGGNTNNIGRNDEINLYDASNNLVDRLTYNDQAPVGSPARGPRTNGFSGNATTPAAYGANHASLWERAAANDAYGSYTSSLGEIGNPGTVVPEPATLAMLLAGSLARIRRR
ncbi:MAG TPA: lamin tail domain-containing protein [Phycisphaerae bacterium]|nr:lamin tail domain-containing protein [Phycisphaerae bacterium]